MVLGTAGLSCSPGIGEAALELLIPPAPPPEC